MLKKDLPQWQFGAPGTKTARPKSDSFNLNPRTPPTTPGNNPPGPAALETQLLTWIRAPTCSSAVSGPDDLPKRLASEASERLPCSSALLPVPPSNMLRDGNF